MNAGKKNTTAGSHPKLVKVYGERNSGTNYITKLSELNLDARVMPGPEANGDFAVRVTRRLRRAMPSLFTGALEAARDRYFDASFSENLGWKHMNPDPERIQRQSLETVRFLITVKNPYAWLLSLFRRPYHVGGKDAHLADLIERRLPVMQRRENIGPDPLRPIEVWNRKVQGYFELQGLACFATIVRYEDLLADPDATLQCISNTLDVGRRDNFAPVTQGVKADDKSIRHTDYADYYLNERWRRDFTPSLIHQINAQLDANLVRKLGYEVIYPDDVMFAAE